MAKSKDEAQDRPQMTDDLDLGPGLVVTPGYAVAQPPAQHFTMSDQPIDRHGNILNAPAPVVANQPEPAQPAPDPAPAPPAEPQAE